MIRVSLTGSRLVVCAAEGELKPQHESQLAFWGLDFDPAIRCFVSPPEAKAVLVQKIIGYLERSGVTCDIGPDVRSAIDERRAAESALANALAKGRGMKSGALSVEGARDFRAYLEHAVRRKLKDHQLKAALHLLSVENGANFSVPGSGKTTVVLTVFDYLRLQGRVDALFVVGPPACFGPWRTEYLEVFGRSPSFEILAGGDVDDRRMKYLVNQDSVCDLYLSTFHTLQRDWQEVRTLFEQQGIRFHFVVDEAHYIKRLDGTWANAVLRVAEHAVLRTILTGTPFPHSYSDAFNLFDVLWPGSPPITTSERHRIELLATPDGMSEAADILEAAIGPLFYRVRKSDLGLAPQQFHPPVMVTMNSRERMVYDSIVDRIREVSQDDYIRDLELVARLRRGRMIRLRQCVSYTALLGSALSEYSEDLLGGNRSLSDVIRLYDEYETPAKLEALVSIVEELTDRGEKVVVWANFVRTLELILEKLEGLGHQARLIYGATPIEKASVSDELTREAIIREFADPASGVRVLVANPAACAESVSLHKACAHAAYYDLSYNCAQYLQSLDRIHRVGGSEHREAHYHFLQYEDTIDSDILANVQAKADRMSHVIDRDYAVYSLDMFDDDGELEAYDRIFGAEI